MIQEREAGSSDEDTEKEVVASDGEESKDNILQQILSSHSKVVKSPVSGTKLNQACHREKVLCITKS